jgi:predicted amidohydrolase
VKISLVQVASPADEPVAVRVERVGAMVMSAAGSDLVVLPELWAPGYFAFDRYAERAETLEGLTVTSGRRWARVLDCHLAPPAARLEHLRLFTTARAVEQQVLLVACNAAGNQNGTALAGHSRVVDPWGQVLVEADAGEGVASCEVDPAVVATVRVEFRPWPTGG